MRTTKSITTVLGVNTVFFGPIPRGYDLRKLQFTHIPTGDIGELPTIAVAITDTSESGSFASGEKVCENISFTTTSQSTFSFDIYINRRLTISRYLMVELTVAGANSNFIISLDTIPKRSREINVS